MALGRSLSSGSVNALKAHRSQKFEADPLALDYKSLEIGESVEFRILSMSEEESVIIPCRKVKITNAKNGTLMDIPVQDPGPEAASRLVDHANQLMSDCKLVHIYRLPVWAYAKVGTSGKREEIGEIRYLEFGQGILNSLFDLDTKDGGLFAWESNESGRPEYDLRLVVVPGTSREFNRNYEVEGICIDPKTRKQRPSFDVPAEEALKDVMSDIEAGWEAVQAAMNVLENTPEQVAKRLARRDSGAPGLSNRPALGGAVDSDRVEVDPADYELTTGAGTAVLTPPKYKFGGAK